MSVLLPRVAISMGDPAGIGPEVTVRALADPEVAECARFVVVGDARLLTDAARAAGVAPPADIHDLPLPDGDAFVPGRLDPVAGRASVGYVAQAVRMCLAGDADAMATGPVNKEAVARAGIPFTGHTEYIAELCGAPEPRMLLVNDRLRVVHVSTHCSLRDACDVRRARVLETIRIGWEAVRWMGVADPRVAVCGLNPHAGEHGLFGDQDEREIRPAVEAARGQGIRCDGPLPADTLFFQAVRGAWDLVVAQYHDQGHIPMKLLDFENTVNVSLGLPLLRTSVDHGTAFDLVGKNLADPSSMKAALRLAATMARARRRERA